MAVTMEALCFVEKYPERKDELVRRLREGRLFLSPFLCNSLWAFHSVEGMVRTLYAARRLEREWGVPIDVAEHIEEPSLPGGWASVLPRSVSCASRSMGGTSMRWGATRRRRGCRV